MRSFLFLLLLTSFLAACGSDGAGDLPTTNLEGDITLIQLQDPLDEPEYYCVDVPGFGSSLDLDGALTAHTCKPNGEDELFVVDYPAVGQFYMPEYGRCMEAAVQDSGGDLYVRECSDSALQKFQLMDDGTIQLVDVAPSLCLTVSQDDGEPTGGPSHLRRDLSLVTCDTADPALSYWAMPGPTVP